MRTERIVYERSWAIQTVPVPDVLVLWERKEEGRGEISAQHLLHSTHWGRGSHGLHVADPPSNPSKQDYGQPDGSGWFRMVPRSTRSSSSLTQATQPRSVELRSEGLNSGLYESKVCHRVMTALHHMCLRWEVASSLMDSGKWGPEQSGFKTTALILKDLHFPVFDDLDSLRNTGQLIYNMFFNLRLSDFSSCFYRDYRFGAGQLQR